MNAIRISGSQIAVTFDYTPEHVATVKGIAQAAGAVKPYDPQTRTWRLPLTCADPLAQAFAAFSWCDQFRALMRGRPSKLAPAAAVTEQHAPEPMQLGADVMAQLSQPLPDGRTPRQMAARVLRAPHTPALRPPPPLPSRHPRAPRGSVRRAGRHRLILSRAGCARRARALGR